jgi:hypothetical protein
MMGAFANGLLVRRIGINKMLFISSCLVLSSGLLLGFFALLKFTDGFELSV